MIGQQAPWNGVALSAVATCGNAFPCTTFCAILANQTPNQRVELAPAEPAARHERPRDCSNRAPMPKHDKARNMTKVIQPGARDISVAIEDNRELGSH